MFFLKRFYKNFVHFLCFTMALEYTEALFFVKILFSHHTEKITTCSAKTTKSIKLILSFSIFGSVWSKFQQNTSWKTTTNNFLLHNFLNFFLVFKQRIKHLHSENSIKSGSFFSSPSISFRSIYGKKDGILNQPDYRCIELWIIITPFSINL